MATSKKIVLEFDIDTQDVKIAGQETLTLVQQLKILKRELQRGDLKPEQFDILRKKVGDVEDRIAKTNTKAKDFFGVLSTLPGPVGAFASSLQQGIELLKIFSSFTFKDIKNSLSDVADDIQEVGDNLSGIGGKESITAISNTTANTDGLAKSVDDLGDKLTKTIQPLQQVSKESKNIGETISQSSGNIAAASANVSAYGNAMNLSKESLVKFSKEQVTILRNLDKLEESLGVNFKTMSDGTMVVKEANGSMRQLTATELSAVKATTTLTASTEGLVAAEKAATFWTTTLGKTIQGVLIATGIGLAIVLIGELISFLWKYVDGTEAAEKAQKSFNDELNKTNVLLELDLKDAKRRQSIRIAELKANGKDGKAVRLQEVKDLKETLKLTEEALMAAGKRENEVMKRTDKKSLEDLKVAQKKTSDLDQQAKDIRTAIRLKELENISENNKAAIELRTKAIERFKEIQTNRLKELDALIKLEIDKEKTSGKTLEGYLIEKLNIRKKLEKLSTAEIQVIKNENAKIENDALIDDIERNIQAEIDRYTRLAEVAGIGTKEQFDERRKVAQQEYLKELQEAERDEKTRATKIENARVNYWKKIMTIDKEALTAIQAQAQIAFSNEYEGTVTFYDKQRELELANYALKQADARDNYEKLEELKREHIKNIVAIDVAEIRNIADLEGRKANVEMERFDTVEDRFFKSFKVITQLEERKYQDLREQEGLNYIASVKAAGDNTKAVEVIEMEHAQKMRQIDADEYEAKKQTQLMVVEATAQMGQQLAQIGDAIMQASAGRDEAMFKAGKAAAIAGIAIEKASAIVAIWTNTAIANAKAVAAFPLTLGQPWVTINTVSAAVSTAATIAAAAMAISQVNSTQFNSSANSSKTQGNQLGRNYADGGMIGGNRHADGGTMIEAEKGEAIMTRGAVAMFGPILSMLNQAGGGTSFSQGAVGASNYDSPKASNQTQDSSPMIVKTYVVANEMQSEAHKQNRLKDLSTL